MEVANHSTGTARSYAGNARSDPVVATPTKPVRAVLMAVSTHVREHAYHFQFDGSRDSIKYLAALQALDILCKDIKVI